MSDLELKIGSMHPWRQYLTAAIETDGPYGDLDIRAAVNIGGVEEFYRLDTMYEITNMTGPRAFVTTWKIVLDGP